MQTIKQQVLTGERALFKSKNLQIEHCVFEDGESPLKESNDIRIQQSIFRWKYPLWYCDNIYVAHSSLLETARSGIWYTHHIEIFDSVIDAPKTFRRASDITLRQVHMPNAMESFWNCKGIRLQNVQAHGDYFGMNSSDIHIDHFQLSGNYAFDGAKNIEVHNARLISKDAFWNCEDVIVYDSTIIGEYLGWNAKNITFVNCTIESLQGLCYMENVKLVNCTLIHTTQAFEYSTVDAKIQGEIDSVMNPLGGRIQADGIKELILDDEEIDHGATSIISSKDAKIPQAQPQAIVSGGAR